MSGLYGFLMAAISAGLLQAPGPEMASTGMRRDPACIIVEQFDLACASTEIGAVAADTASDAERLKVLAARGEQRFRRFLGKEPDVYLFIAGSGGRYSQAARAVGRKSSLNWPSAAQRMDTTALRRSAEASLADLPMSPSERAAAIEAFVKSNSSSKAEQDALDAIAVPHELAHVWFTRAFWPAAPVADQDYYAGPGPDWLDEAVTQIMESDGSAAYPFSKYKEAISGPAALREGDLAALLRAEHPGQKMKQLFADRDFIPAAESEAAGIEPLWIFYARSAAVAAFILDRSDAEQVIAEIASAYADGSGFEIWLDKHGEKYEIGATVSEMESLLLAWLREQGRGAEPFGQRSDFQDGDARS